MIEPVFDEVGRLVSPVEYPLPDCWNVINENQLRDSVASATTPQQSDQTMECVPWTAVKTKNGNVIPALKFAQQLSDRSLVSVSFDVVDIVMNNTYFHFLNLP